MGIKLENVTKIYQAGDVKTIALKNVDLEMKKGD